MTGNRTAQTAKKYKGRIAETYDDQRQGKLKWIRENEEVTKFLLNNVPTDVKILDIPVGTGRFIEFYAKHGYHVEGRDVSEDMIEIARKKRNAYKADHVYINEGSILNLEYQDDYFHTALAIRIMNLLDTVDMQRALRNLQRVSSNFVVFNVRIDNGSGKWRHPQSMESIKEALLPNWYLYDNIRIHEDDFRLLILKKDFDYGKQ